MEDTTLLTTPNVKLLFAYPIVNVCNQRHMHGIAHQALMLGLRRPY